MIVSSPRPTRSETMIALRARREAKRIADTVAYPHLSCPIAPQRLPRYPRYRFLRLSYLTDFIIVRPVELLAPTWMIWLPVGCVAAIVAAAIVILKTVR